MVNFKIPRLLNAIHTDRNWGHFLGLTNNKCFINCPKTILSHLYTYIHIYLLDIEKYVRTIHSLLASKFGYWFSSFKALSLIHTIHIFMNGLLYLICYMIFSYLYLLDTEKICTRPSQSPDTRKITYLWRSLAFTHCTHRHKWMIIFILWITSVPYLAQ